MDQRIIDNLHELERVARDTRPRRTNYYEPVSGSGHNAIYYRQTAQGSHDLLPAEDFYLSGDQGLNAYSKYDLGQQNISQYQYDEGYSPARDTQVSTSEDLTIFESSSSHVAPQQETLARSNISQFAHASSEVNFSPYRNALTAQHTSLNQRPPHPSTHRSDHFEPHLIPQLDRSIITPSYIKTREKHTGPVIQGIPLVSTHKLPDRLRSIFPFPFFNAIQSKSFETIFNSGDNFVLSSPTGSGKTAVLELAICRLMNNLANGSYKIVYQAPTKSLCSERQRDWQSKFGTIDIQVAELTGDTDHVQLRNVQHASIIITTPEKWDSMTRKWKDHQKLMQMVKLFLLDEVHMLKEDRGATLEAVVSRMKSVGSNVRFIALSATIPNLHDIAAWLGKNSSQPELPAPQEKFGEEFRPVKLQKHVCGYQANSNDFAFEKTLNAKLPDVISKWSQRKPIMVFCFIRSSCVDTAKFLSNWWISKDPKERYWSCPRKEIPVENKDLRDVISSGVAFHHAGLSNQDRAVVENAYLNGDINVICCTSTLAMGVNLPCHMVIIKNTVAYQGNGTAGCSEYSDLEVMQMLGRAGRPQFDDSAVAVVMTRLQRVDYYEKTITGQEVIESCLHRNLIDHLNAEIGLGTITSASSARKWLSSTFLYVRLKHHPEHYKIENGSNDKSLDERLDSICKKGMSHLEEYDLVRCEPKLHCTEFGNAMARYYVQFDTMKAVLALPPKARVSEILSAIAKAAEFKEVRFRSGEKSVYKDLNKNPSVKYPIPVNLDLPAHKVSLVIQSVLAAIEIGDDYKARQDYNTAKSMIFNHAPRLIRCIIDCQLHLSDAVSVRNALMLARSFGAQVWDDSPLHMKQLSGLGLVSIRKLVGSGIKSIGDIEATESHVIETILTRNPPFGVQLQEKAKEFPKLRVTLQTVREPIVQKGQDVILSVKAEIGFLNEKTPEYFNKRPVFVCFLAETSDGHKAHFARISAKKLNQGQDILFKVNLTNVAQTIRAYVTCDDLAGTSQHAVLQHGVSAECFPISKRIEARKQIVSTDEFGDAEIEDADLVNAEPEDDFVNIDDLDATEHIVEPLKEAQKTKTVTEREPRQLPNGKWACNHVCKDKNTCKHLCCREGLDKKPRISKPRESKKSSIDPKQTQLSDAVKKNVKATKPDELQTLNRLHNNVQSNTRPLAIVEPKPIEVDQGRAIMKRSGTEMSSEAPFKTRKLDYGPWDSDDLPSQAESPTRKAVLFEEMLDDGFSDDLVDPMRSDFKDTSLEELTNAGSTDTMTTNANATPVQRPANTSAPLVDAEISNTQTREDKTMMEFFEKEFGNDLFNFVF